MLTLVFLIAGLIWISGVIMLVIGMRRAPHGFEDESGFHEVPSPPESRAIYGGVSAESR